MEPLEDRSMLSIGAAPQWRKMHLVDPNTGLTACR
jgi:hypothetical protein